MLGFYIKKKKLLIFIKSVYGFVLKMSLLSWGLHPRKNCICSGNSLSNAKINKVHWKGNIYYFL